MVDPKFQKTTLKNRWVSRDPIAEQWLKERKIPHKIVRLLLDGSTKVFIITDDDWDLWMRLRFQ